MVGTICSYPKFTPVPFQEDSLWQGYPEETNAPVRHRQAGPARRSCRPTATQYGQNAIYLMPTNLYGPGDKFHPAVSHVIPALIKKCVDAKEAGADHIEVWGTGSASREFLYVDDAAEGIVLAAERYDGAEPVNLGADQELPIKELVGLDRRGRRLRGRGPVGHVEARRAAAPRGSTPSRADEQFGFAATTSFDDGPAAHRRLVPRQPRRSRGPRTSDRVRRAPRPAPRKFGGIVRARPVAQLDRRLPAERVGGRG